MRTHTALNWAIALCIVGTYALVQHIDNIDDISHAQASILSLQDSLRMQAATRRVELAAVEMCGYHPWRMTPDGTIVCKPVEAKK